MTIAASDRSLRPTHARVGGLSLLGVYLLALLPAVLFALAQPIPSRVDEAQHADVLAQYAAGVYPVEGATMLRPEIVALLRTTGVYRWNLPGTRPLPAEDDPAAFTRPAASATPAARALWTKRHVWGFSYEAMQPPLYYLLAEPCWLAGVAAGGTMGGVVAARLFSAALAALLAPLAYLFVRELDPERTGPAFLAAGLAALLPGFELNATQVTNDGLAAVFGAALLVLLARSLRRGWTVRRGVLAGLLFGLACLAKLTALALAPALLLAFVWRWRRRSPTSAEPGVRAALAGVGVAVLVVSPWMLANLLTYGHPLPGAETAALLRPAFPVRGPSAGWLAASLGNAFATFWAGEPLGTLPNTWPLVALAAAWGALAVAGLALGLRGGRLQERRLLALAAAALVLGVAWSAALPWMSHVGGYLPGRYLYPAAPLLLGLYAVGTWQLPRTLALASGGLTAAVAAASSALLLAVGPGIAAHVTAPPAEGAGEPVSAASSFHGLELHADRVLVKPGGREAYVHLTAVNTGTSMVEWNPLPLVHSGGRATFSDDYAGSSPFPEALAPGGSFSGWLHLGPRKAGPVPYLELSYPDVAADGYAAVGTIDVWIWSVPKG